MTQKERHLYILKNYSTRDLLKVYRIYRSFDHMTGAVRPYAIKWGWMRIPSLDKYAPTHKDWPHPGEYWSEGWVPCTVRLTIGKFSKLNPHKGKTMMAWYKLSEIKEELSKREHIERK